MLNNDNLSKLQHQLCELKLEERRVCSDIRHLVTRNKTIDFFQAKQLNSLRTGVKRKLKKLKPGLCLTLLLKRSEPAAVPCRFVYTGWAFWAITGLMRNCLPIAETYVTKLAVFV